MIGWLITGVLMAAFVVALIAQRRRKASKERTHYLVTLGGFPITHVPREAVASADEARAVVVKLKEVYRTAWAAFGGIYNESTRAAPIDTIGMSTTPVHPEHPEVVWFAPTSMMRLRFQDSMHYHFAGELHNMFRFNLYGIEHIYDTVDDADRANAERVQAWIEENYG